MSAQASPSPRQLRITRPDDWHVHLRDGAALAHVLTDTARRFGRAVIMPNLRPPVTTVADALAYRSRILSALPADMTFEPLMALYLTDATSADEVRRAADAPDVIGFKLYPAGATTNSDAGISALAGLDPILASLESLDVPLLVHGEVTDPTVDIFDREAVFIERHLTRWVERFPALRIVVEHATTAEAVDFVAAQGPRVAASLTAHHLLYDRNALFAGGLRPHFYCLPVLKRDRHRQALLAAATSGNPKFFLGTDSAPHPQRLKESDCGCAGCYTAHAAIELYAAAFDQVAALDRLEGFASFHGADFYGHPRNPGQIALIEQAWTVPASLPFGDDCLIPLEAGKVLRWRLAD